MSSNFKKLPDEEEKAIVHEPLDSE
jgi:hypothetical protein